MKKYALLVLALSQALPPMACIAGDKSSEVQPKPASFVPHSHSSHVYGSPISSAILGHAKSTHQKTVHPKTRPIK